METLGTSPLELVLGFRSISTLTKFSVDVSYHALLLSERSDDRTTLWLCVAQLGAAASSIMMNAAIISRGTSLQYLYIEV